MSEHDEVIGQFKDVTGVEDERARFYLESAGWKLDIALASFFEDDGTVERPAGDGEDEVMEDSPAGGRSGVQPAEPRAAATLNHRLIEMSSDDDSDSDEEGQAFYVGGSERSGQQVIGPPRQKGKDVAGEMFKSAKEQGAVPIEKGASGSSKKSVVFKGTGYRLGQSDDDTQVIPGAREAEPPRAVTLKLWKTGFSIDEGPVRDYQNPANKEFLDCIKRGEVPQELIRESRGRSVHLQMEDHRTEEFLSRKSRFQAFGGEGHALGNPTPSVVQATPAAVSAAAAAPVDLKSCEEKAKSELGVVETEPTTNVQIRLADGSRLIGHFNHTNTVGQVRHYIITARPQYSSQPFALLTSYPSQELKDEHATLKETSLLGGTIMQRMK